MSITFDEKLEAAWGLHKIEKAVLEKEIAELRERLAEADECNRRVSDENEKLRAALKPFAAAAITYEPCGFRIEWDIIPIDIDAARKALGETDD